MTHAASPQPSRRSWADWLLIGVFAVWLGLPALDAVTGIDHAKPAAENRLLARNPGLSELNLAGLQSLLAAEERYVRDHFGFRNQLLHWCQQWRRLWFHDQGASMSETVVRGRNGWLFYGGEQMVDHCLGRCHFSPAQLATWRGLLEKRRDWLAARGIHYLFVIPPDKQTIYPEQLPAWLEPAARPPRETKVDQLVQYLHWHSTVPILDLRPPLQAAKAGAPVYLQQDSHWNARGSFIGCQTVVATLAGQISGLAPLRQEDFSWSRTAFAGGDLARMLGLSPPEQNYYTWVPGAAPSTPLVIPVPEPASGGMTRTNWMTDNTGPMTATAVVFHDSFGASWPPFLGCGFKQVAFRWGTRLDPRVIEESHPQVVITEMLERFVNTVDPAALAAQDQLP